MARKRKGRAVHGWLIIDKPVGMTSTAVVNKARWAYQAQKAGHAGTLDPLASGLLAVAFGEATKTIPIAQEGLKTYQFTIRLGQSTTTDDAEGDVVETSDLRPPDNDIRAGLSRFIGDIEQVPPQFSAVKVEGARAYDLARDGVEMDLAPRALYVDRLELTDRPDPDHASFQLVCGKGGYVRSIARDLGEDLGCRAHVSNLRRIASGGFTLERAVPFARLDEIREDGGDDQLRPLEAGLTGLPEVRVPEAEAARLSNGNPASVTHSTLGYGDEAWASLHGVPIAIVTYKAGLLHPDRVFVGLNDGEIMSARSRV